MADSLFSIFPDGQMASVDGLKGKGKVLGSKKQALCDVKNTLTSKFAAGNVPLRKPGFQDPCKSDNICKESSKQITLREAPAIVTPRPAGTFTIACDEEESDNFWDCCGKCSSAELSGDLFLDLRPLSTQLKEDDIKYVTNGLFYVEREKHIPEWDGTDYEYSSYDIDCDMYVADPISCEPVSLNDEE